MLETIKNAFKSKDIRIKIWMTLFMVFIFRVGSFIPIPGLSGGTLTQALGASKDSGLNFVQVLSTLSGGSLAQGTLFSLGILPFINAFIIIQLLSIVIPSLQRLTKEGESGRERITQITRYIAIVLAIVQAIGVIVAFKKNITPLFSSFEDKEKGNAYLTYTLIATILVGGSCMVMWLSERITEYGIGNGTSIIIFVGIIAQAGTTLAGSFKYASNNLDKLWNIFGFLLITVAIFVFIIFFDIAERRINVQYSKQVRGNRMYGGQSTYIPIKVNANGVMPIIFASSIVIFPQMIFQLFAPESKATAWYAQHMGSGKAPYYIFLILFIFFFAFFYSQIQFNPDDVSKNIQQYGGFIPGIRAGKPTSDYLRKINNRITLFGAIFLAVVALIPSLIFRALAGWNSNELGFGHAFSATGLLMVVSVSLELHKQLEAQIMMKHYKGFLK